MFFQLFVILDPKTKIEDNYEGTVRAILETQSLPNMTCTTIHKKYIIMPSIDHDLQQASLP